jgi:hypothetical protein
VVADRHDHAGPTADLDHDGVADRLETPADAPATTPADAPAESPAPAAAELKPGDVAVAPVAFLTDDKVQDLRQRWREAQFGFVDDPRQAAEDVRSLVNEAIDTVTASLAGQRDALGTGTGRRHRAVPGDGAALPGFVRQTAQPLTRTPGRKRGR